MEENFSKSKSYPVDFKGDGQTYFGIIIINWLLTAVTLGFYYPWAKEKNLKYLYSQTTLNGSPFEFHGTGKEMFKGFIKAFGVVILLYALLFALLLLGMGTLGILLFYIGFIALLPIAIHGSYKYRMSRTSWRGIRFGYRGDRNELLINFFKWFGLTIITLGIYGSWFSINLRKYIIGNIRFGDIEMEYDGNGAEYFMLNLKGYLLTLITFGIYGFWWQQEIIEYYINNLKMHKDNQSIDFQTTVTGGGIFKLTIVNIILMIFTLGLAYAWVQMRTFKYIASNIELEGTIDLDTIHQTEAVYKDATGEDIGDMLDMDFVM